MASCRPDCHLCADQLGGNAGSCLLQITSINNLDFDFVLRYLHANQERYTFKAIWAVNIPWAGALQPGMTAALPLESCSGFGTLCRGVLGSTQLAKEQMVDMKDGLLGVSYDVYKTLPSFVPFQCAEGTGIVPLDLVEAQASIFLQVLLTFFRFRPIPDPVNWLRDTYEDIRSYMREGSVVAQTWNGPVSFSPIGQNTARLPPTLQYTYDERLGLVFPSEKASTTLVYPSEAQAPCPRPEVQVKVFLNRSQCPLCAPWCQTMCTAGQMQYANDLGEIYCPSCAAGYYSAAGHGEAYVTASACTRCAAGTFAAAEASHCSTCPPGALNGAFGSDAIAGPVVSCMIAWLNAWAGSFQPEEGQFGCVSCDSLGNDVYQEQGAQTSCEACATNTQRYLGLLSAANKSSCQCKKGDVP